MNFTVTKTPVQKVSIFITQAAMWDNYVSNWKNMAYEEYVGTADLDRVAKILCNPIENFENYRKLINLFRDGSYTYFLMGHAMTEIDAVDVLVEIVVVDGDKKWVIYHTDIRF